MKENIPKQLMGSSARDIGFLPDTGVRIANGVLIQGTSRSVWVVSVVLILIGISVGVAVPLPIDGRVALVLLFVLAGASSAIGVPMMRAAYGVSVRVDRERRTLNVIKKKQLLDIKWENVMGLQLIQQVKGRKVGNVAQLNLIYSGNDGIQRVNLYSSSSRFMVRRMAMVYESYTGWRIYDHSNDK
ncbi:MAG: hypothetical protein R3E01_36115 [Pirellulaceae bacterium]